MRNAITIAGSAVSALILACLILVKLGGIVACIWLLARGDWRLVVLGFLLGIVMPWAMTIASLPSMGLAALLFGANDSPNRSTVAVFGFVFALWDGIQIAAWTAYVFFLFTGRIVPGATVPLLLWTYSTIMAPLAYMASKEPEDSPGTVLGILLALAIYVVLLVTYLVGASRGTAFFVVAIVAIIEAGLATSLGVAMTPRREQSLRSDHHPPQR